MTILNFFKKKKKKKGSPLTGGKKEVKKPKIRELTKEKPNKIETTEQKVEKEVKTQRKHKIAHLILESPHIAEKSTRLYKIDQYAFKVYPRANKSEIKKAIEEIYGVDVLKVRTIKVPKRKRRLGKTIGWKKGYKKAIVTIKKGQEIEILPK